MMEPAAVFRVALKALGANRLRSLLTLLGIVIGVAVVIVMVAIGSGARRTVEQHVKAAGMTLVQVTAGNYSQGDQDPGSGEAEDTTNLAGGAGVSDAPVARRAAARGGDWAGAAVSPRLPGRGAATTLSVADVASIGTDVDGVRYVAAALTETAVMEADGRRLFGRLQGTEAIYEDMRALTVREGRFLRARDVENRRQVAVLTDRAAKALFPGVEAVEGRTVVIRRRPFEVVGVIARPPAVLAGPNALDEVFVPYTALQDLLAIKHLHGVAVSVASAGDSTRVARDVTKLLRVRHRLGDTDPDDFTVRTQANQAVAGKNVNPMFARAVTGGVVNLDDVTMAEIAVSLERSTRTMTALLASVAGVSLLVGGIGIMNIMLVSVTERTREIGLRLAMGARGRDVLLQFLAEAVALSTIGGLVGIALGVGVSGSVGRLLRWSTAVSPLSVAVAVFAAAAIGVFFGFYPARQASRLDPIDALRFE